MFTQRILSPVLRTFNPSLVRRMPSRITGLFKSRCRWTLPQTALPRRVTVPQIPRYLFSTISCPFYRKNGDIVFPDDLQKRGYNTEEARQFLKEVMKYRDREAMKLLIKKRFEKSVNRFGQTEKAISSDKIEMLLCYLIRSSDFTLIKEMVPLFPEESLKYCSYLFHEKVKQGNLKQIITLCELGLRPWTYLWREYAADLLLSAIYYKKMNIVRYLLENTEYNVNAHYPFSIATVLKDIGIEEYFVWYVDYEFVEECSGWDRITPVYLSILMDEPTILKQLIAFGADPNVKTKKNPWHGMSQYASSEHVGLSPLHMAIGYNRKKCFKVIIKDPNLDLNDKDPKGRTPLKLAIEKKRAAMAKALLDKGAKL